MAITATHYRLFKSLPLPQGGSLLEIGEANWYGDLDPGEMLRDFDTDPAQAENIMQLHSQSNRFNIAKIFYELTFAPSRIVAIDYNGTPDALRQDLNHSLKYHRDLCERSPDGVPLTKPLGFDVVINHGTAEHIFNIAQVFRTMHDACAVNGLMVHDAPFTGWIDHGFYCLHPTLFYDLAAANCYEIVKVAIHEIQSKQIIPLEGRDHVAQLASGRVPWSPISNGDEHAVIRSPKTGHSPPSVSQLRNECSDWLKAWCPSWEMAEQIAREHNAKSAIPNNSQLFVALRKLCDKPFKVPMQGVYAGALSEAGKQAWERLR